jgi:hypothetical protein
MKSRNHELNAMLKTERTRRNEMGYKNRMQKPRSSAAGTWRCGQEVGE